MLSITTKSGASAKDLSAVASYPDEQNKSNEVNAVEDYYNLGSSATPSQWLGAGAKELGLSGPVERGDHLRTLQGLDPKNGEALVQGAGESRKYGFDLTFSAPKSVSIAWAAGSDYIKKGIEAAQDRAVEKTLTYIEERFTLARQGSSSKGTITMQHAKLVAAGFRHGSSRELDPQLHTHLMLQNIGLRPDGTWGALNERELFEWKMALGAVYRSELSKGINVLGFKIEADREYFRLAGIPPELEAEFSKRRAQIVSALNENGFSGAKASEIAALDTRKGKDVFDSEILQEEWRKIACEHGVDQESIKNLRSFENESHQASIQVDRAELLRKMTCNEAVFQEKDIVRHVAVGFSQNGHGVDAVNSEVLALKHDPELVKLRGTNGRNYYTTREMLALEKEIQSLSRDGLRDMSHILSPEVVQAAISRFEREKGFSLSNEQTSAIEHVTRDAGNIKIIQGHAGAGKSTALVPVRYSLEASGFEVVGCSLQGKKAAGLEKDTGIKSQTIASLLREIKGYEREDGSQAPPTKTLTEKTVVVVDEAAMNDTRLMAGLIRETEKAGAKLLLIGDESQVPPVAAGNPFKTLKQKLGYAELTENRRQRQEWQKKASREIRAGQVKEGLQKYLAAGMIAIAGDRNEAIKETVESWADRFNPDSPNGTLLTAYKRADVREMNARARESMQERYLFSGPRIETTVRDREGNSEGKREFQAGDRLYFKKNDRKMGVMNGETGTLTNIEVSRDGKECSFTVKMDKGLEVRFDPRDYAAIDHGYAITIHKSQGETVDFSSNLVTGMGLNALYVQLTRHRDGTRIVLTEDQIDKMAQNSGVELEPTDKMIDFTERLLAKDPELTSLLPEDWSKNFDACREFLDKYSGIDIGGRKEKEGINFDHRLEKVKALLTSIRKNEKMNALDFDVVEEKEKKEEERKIGKEVAVRSMDSPSTGGGKRAGIRIETR